MGLTISSHSEVISSQKIWNPQVFEFRNAIKEGDLTKVQDLVSENLELIKYKDPELLTPFLLAVAYGHDEIANFFLKEGNSVQARDLNGKTALLVATANGQIEMVKFLLSPERIESERSKLDERDKEGNTALLVAAAHGEFEMMKLLLSKGASLDEKNNNEKNVLEIAEDAQSLVLWHLVQLPSVCKWLGSNTAFLEKGKLDKCLYDGSDAGKSVLWFLASQPEGRQVLIEHPKLLESRNLEAGPTQGEDAGKTVLWLLENHPETKALADKIKNNQEQQIQEAVQHFIEEKKAAERIKVDVIEEKQIIQSDDKVSHFIEERLRNLGVNSAGNQTTSFIELGGNTEKWHTLMHEIETQFMIALDGLQENGRIIDVITRSKEKMAASQCLVRWRSNRRDADKKPAGLFLIHPIMGGIAEYRTLCENLNTHILEQRNLALYIFKSPILDLDLDSERFKEDYSEKWCTLEHQAEVAIKAIKAVQPHGPYYLCGWSYGGVLTIEIARQLKIANEKVKFIGLVDPQVPEQLRALDKAMLINRLLMHINYISGVTLTNKQTLIDKAVLEEVQAEGQGLIQAAFQIAFQNLGLENTDSGYKKLRSILYTLQANYLAAYNYFPELKEQHKLDRVVVYIAGEKAEFLPKAEYSLNELMPYLSARCLEPKTEYTNHFDIVTKAQFANMLMRHINYIGTIKLEDKMMRCLSLYYQSTTFSKLQSLYDDIYVPLLDCEFNVQSIKPRSLQIASLFLKEPAAKHIFLTGKGCIGKSSGCRKLVLDNLSGKIWPEKRWVFYLPMQNVLNYVNAQEHPIIDNNACIETLLYHEFFKVAGLSFAEVQTAWSEIKNSPQQVCFIIDEVDGVLERPELEFIFKFLFKSELSVIVSAGELHFKRLKNLGFAAEHKFKVDEIVDEGYIRKFIENYFNQLEEDAETLTNSLCEAIETSPSLRNLSKNPLYLTQICAVWRHRFQQDKANLSTRQLTQILAENIFQQRGNENGQLLLTEDMRLQQQLVFKFLSLCAYRAMLSNSHSISSKEMQSWLSEFKQEPKFIEKILETGVLVPAGIDTPWLCFEFNNQLMQLYFASEYFVESVNADKVDDNLLRFIENGIKKFEAGLFCEFLLSPLKEKSNFQIAQGLHNLLNRLGEAWKNCYELNKIEFLSRATEIALSIPVPDSELKEHSGIIERMAPVLYCFSSEFATAYPVQGRKDQADVESDKLFLYKDTVDKLKSECPHLFAAVEEVAKVEYRGKEGVLHYAVKKKNQALTELLLDLGADPESRNDEGLKPIDIAREAGFNEGTNLINQGREKTSVKYLRRNGVLKDDKKKLSKSEIFQNSKNYVHKMLAPSRSPNRETEYVNKLKDEVIRDLLEQWLNKAPNSQLLDNYIKTILEGYFKVKVNASEASVKEKTEFHEVCQYIKENLLKVYVKDKQNAVHLLRQMLERGEYKNLRPILLDHAQKKLEMLHQQYDVFYDEIHNILRNEKRNTFINPWQNICFALDKFIGQSPQTEAFSQFARDAIEQCVQSTLMIECFDSNISLFLQVVLEDYRNKKLLENSELTSAIKGFLTLVCQKCYQSEIEKEITHLMAQDVHNGTVGTEIFSLKF